MKKLLNKLFEPRYPARYVGRHRAPSALPQLTVAIRRTRAAVS